MDLSGLGRVFVAAAVVIAAIGILLILAGRGILPRLPGDIAIERRGVRIFIPIGTSILVSVILTVLLNLFLRR